MSARQAHISASVESIDRRDVIYSVVAKLGRGFQCVLFAAERSWWIRLVMFIVEHHTVGPLLLGLAHYDLTGLIDVCVFR
jgi:hypothetical protein